MQDQWNIFFFSIKPSLIVIDLIGLNFNHYKAFGFRTRI